MKVLYIAKMNKDSGVACFLMNYFRNMQLQNIKVDFLSWDTRQQNFYKEIRKLGGRVITVTSYKKNPVKFLMEINEVVKDGKYDIVHGHEAIMNLPIFFSAKFHGVKNIIGHSHNAGMPTKMKDIIVKICRPLFAVSTTEYMACSYHSGCYLFGKKNFEKRGRVVLNAIDVGQFKFDPDIRIKYREEMNLKDELVIGHVGRFNEQKNHKFLIDVFFELQKKVPNSKLVLIGEGEKKAIIEEQVRNLNIANKVKFLGIRTDVSCLMQAMDYFVFPSIFEGLGIVLIEAQAAGLKCLVSSEVPKEAACSSDVAYMSLNMSAEEWAKHIIKELEKNHMREQGMQKVQQKGYDIKKSALQLEKYYIKIGEDYGKKKC